MENILVAKNLSKKFKNSNVVENLSISVKEGDIYGFLGPNGAGKSTTIKMMLGLVTPSEGTTYINGYDVNTEREEAIKYVGAMVEAPSFYGYMTGFKNLKLYANLLDKDDKRINEVLDIVGLTKAANKKVDKYSLGMKQRLAIARAFLNNPKIVILDEPTNGLDPQGVIEIRNLIKKLSVENHVTFLVCSHILSEIQNICNRISIINNGKLVVEGNTQELIKNNNCTNLEEYYLKVLGLGEKYA